MKTPPLAVPLTMPPSRRLLSPLLGLSLCLLAGMAGTTTAFAETSTPISTPISTSTSSGQDEEVVVFTELTKNSQNNQAINESFGQIGNAIRGNGNIKANANSSINASIKVDNNIATAIASDKLILNSPVIDEVGILSSKEKRQLENKLRSVYQQGLAQMAVVIIPTTDGTPIFDYAMQTAERWGLGGKDTDDGLLILVAVNDRDMYILSGYGLEGVLPDGALGTIIRNDIRPYFKQGDYAGGLNAGIGRITERLTTDPQILAQSDKLAKQREQEETGGNAGVDPIFLFFVCLFFNGFVTNILGRMLGGSLVSAGFFAVSVFVFGNSFLMSLILAVFLWFFITGMGSGGGGKGKGGRRRRRRRNVVIPSSFGNGGFGSGGSSGGFSGGGFSGGGGGFGGGGAGGSW